MVVGRPPNTTPPGRPGKDGKDGEPGITGMPFPKCRIHRTTNKSININAATFVDFPTADTVEDYDFDEMHAEGALRLVAPIDGVYALSAGVQFAAGLYDATLSAVLVVNSGTDVAQHQLVANGADPPYLNPKTDWFLAAGGYVELVVYQEALNPLNIVATGAKGIWLAAAYLP